ncbi:hypothetical protein [Parelusimicrobium proximum]
MSFRGVEDSVESVVEKYNMKLIFIKDRFHAGIRQPALNDSKEI